MPANTCTSDCFGCELASINQCCCVHLLGPLPFCKFYRNSVQRWEIGFYNLKLFPFCSQGNQSGFICMYTITLTSINIYTFSSLVLNISSFFGKFDNLWFLKCFYFIAGYRFNVTSIETQANPFAVSFDICNKLIPNQVYVVIVSHPAEKILSPMAASYTCGFYQIPILAITARDSAFSDKVGYTNIL